ncbi:glycosyltransferase family 39 protein [Salibacteraceae bacterium]|nr:glycosyltransferase family 39 protein [Salibacteraceae bacterium]
MRHPVTFVFLIAFTVRLGYAILIQFLYPESIYLFDSWGYLNIAYNLFNEGVFSQMTGDQLTADSTRTPFYPIYIYLFHLLQLHGEWIIFIQALIGAFTAAIAARCALLIKRNRLAAFVVGLLVAFDIPSVYFSNTVLPETWFGFFLVCALFYLIKSVKYDEPSHRIYVMLFLVLATYTKPIAIYLLIAMPFILLIFNQQGIKFELIQLTKFVVIGTLLLSPWLYRNQQTFGGVFFSSIAEVNLLFHTASNIKAIAKNSNRHTIEYEYRNSKPLSELAFEYNPHVIPLFREYARKECFQVVQQYPEVTFKMMLKSWVGFFVKPLRSYIGMQLYGKKLGDEPALTNVDMPNSYWASFKMALKRANWLEESAIIIQILLLGLLLLSIIFSLPLWFSSNWQIGLILLFLILYFSVTSSITDVDARFRVPIVSYIILLGYPIWCKILAKYNYE